MKKTTVVLITAIFSIILFNNSIAQTGKNTVISDSAKSANSAKNSINACPFGVAFGIFVVNYERLIQPHHGLVARLDYEMIPKTYSDANIESNGYAFTLNYRYHFNGQMSSWFAGAYGRAQVYTGEGKLEAEQFNFDIYDYTIGLNAGKKWVWKNGLTATFSLGYGYDIKTRTQSVENPGVDNAIDAFEDGYDFMNPFMGELSIGYSF